MYSRSIRNKQEYRHSIRAKVRELFSLKFQNLKSEYIHHLEKYSQIVIHILPDRPLGKYTILTIESWCD